MKALFVDTETTNLCDMRTPYTEETLKEVWPHITQLAYKVVEVTELGLSKPIVSVNVYIRPNYPQERYSADAERVSGISYDFLQKYGTDIAEQIRIFLDTLSSVDFVVSHNTTFDMKMIKAEMMRIGDTRHLRTKPWLDTVYYGGEFIKVADGVRKRVFPKLIDLYVRLFQKVPSETLHNADSDVDVCMQCFAALMQNGTIPLSRIQQRIDKHISSEENPFS